MQTVVICCLGKKVHACHVCVMCALKGGVLSLCVCVRACVYMYVYMYVYIEGGVCMCTLKVAYVHVCVH